MGRPTIAVGDIHGQCGLLRSLVDEMLERFGRFRLVTLGDYIDRGPDSRGVIDLLLNLPKEIELVPLMGNHEQFMVDALIYGSFSALDNWLHNGGREALASYGWKGQGFHEVPLEHLDFLESLRLHYDDGERLFVHAGVDPAVDSLEEQKEGTLLWIREPFLSTRHKLDRVVVHGHTPAWDGPENRGWRINLDSGAFRTHRLSAGVFRMGDPDPQFFVSSPQGVREIEVPLVPILDSDGSGGFQPAR